MKAEYAAFERVEAAIGDEAEVRHVFFVFHAPGLVLLFAIHLFEACMADVFFAGRAISKAPMAGAKYRSEDTIAGYIRPGAAAFAQSKSLALRAAFLS
jgi:hypothetical protein